MARPRGGDWLEAEVSSLRAQGVDVWVSTLTSAERQELDLENQNEYCRNAGIDLWKLAIADRALPNTVEFCDHLKRIRDQLDQGKTVVVHCRMGIGRAGLISAGLLITEGEDAEAAIRRVSAARGMQIPDTEEQRKYLLSLRRG